MRLSTRGRYGVRVLLELALRQGEGPVQLKEVACQQQISLPYVEHLIAPLVAAGLLRTVRGPKGGVELGKGAEHIRLSEAIELLEGPMCPVACVEDPSLCSRSEHCVTRDIWANLKSAMDGVFGSLTLRDLVQRQMQKLNSPERTHRT